MVLLDDLERWDVGGGEGSPRSRDIHVDILLICFTVQQHGNVIIFKLKEKSKSYYKQGAT